MVDKTTKTVKVPDDTAEEWDEYVDETPEVDSVSHLIRLSVLKEMNDESDVETLRIDDGSRELSGEVLTSLRKIETAIGDIEERLTALEDVETAEANYDIQKASYNFLPTPPESAYVPEPEGKGSYVWEDADFDEWAVTAEETARKLGAEEEEVKDALDQLQETTGQVQSVTQGSERFDIGDSDSKTYYWKKGQ